MSLIPNYLYPHNCPLNFTNHLEDKIYYEQFSIVYDDTFENWSITISPEQVKILQYTTSLLVVNLYGNKYIDGNVIYGFAAIECVITNTVGVEGGLTITMASINSIISDIAYLVYNFDDFKRWLKISVKDTVDNSDPVVYLLQDKLIEVAVDSSYNYTFNANSYALQFLRAPELIFDNQFTNPNGGWLDIDVYSGNNTRLKTLCISVIDFSVQNPQYVFVGWQAQGFPYYNSEFAAVPLGLNPVNVYSWLNQDNNYQIYIWLDIILNTELYKDVLNNSIGGKAPAFKVNRWFDDGGNYILNESLDIPANFTPISNPITCPVPYTYQNYELFDAPASFTAPLLFNLNTNINIDNVALHLPSGTDIAQPVLMWFNLMGGVEYQQMNVNEDGTIYKGKFSVKQNESVYYIDNANVKHEITNARVIDSMQLSVTLMRERTAQSDRLSQLALSKNVYLFYGLAGEAPIRAKVPLLAKRNSFTRFEGATTVQLTMEFDFAQDVDIKI
jgi:hypothetical protein